MHGKKSVIYEIMANRLPPDERMQFKNLANDTSSEDFFRLLPSFFNDEEIKSGIAEYAMEHLTELENETGARIDAIITSYGQQFNYRSFNEVAGI